MQKLWLREARSPATVTELRKGRAELYTRPLPNSQRSVSGAGVETLSSARLQDRLIRAGLMGCERQKAPRAGAAEKALF